MQEALLTWDRKTLIYLNNLGTESFDTFWSILTYTPIWIPLFIFFIFLFKKKHSRQEAAIKISTVLLMVVFIILVTHWTKVSIERIRPNNNTQINTHLRILKMPTDYSFFSGHASSSVSITLLVFLFLRKKWKWSLLFFLWPMLFSYSRIYVGVHYPSDIIFGLLAGILSALLFYYSHNYFFPTKSK